MNGELLAPPDTAVVRKIAVIPSIVAKTYRPAPLAAPGPRYAYSVVGYLDLLRSYYLTASLPSHVTKLVNAWGDADSLVAFIAGILTLAHSERVVPRESVEEVADRLDVVAEKLDAIDPEWAERLRYYESEVRTYLR